jgi:hypothetical protein
VLGRSKDYDNRAHDARNRENRRRIGTAETAKKK